MQNEAREAQSETVLAPACCWALVGTQQLAGAGPGGQSQEFTGISRPKSTDLRPLGRPLGPVIVSFKIASL